MADNERLTAGQRGTSPRARETQRQAPAQRTLTATISPENQWEQDNPTGRADTLGQRRLILWNFKVDDTALKQKHRLALNRFAALFTTGSAINNGIPVYLIGRASDSGSHGNNISLGQGRAEAVREYLLARLSGHLYPDGESPQQRVRLQRLLVVRNYDDSRPLRPNITPQLMAYNRSVEIVIRVNRAAPLPCREDIERRIGELPFPPVVIRMLRPYIERNIGRMSGGTHTDVIPNTIGRGRNRHGNFLIKLCCSSRHPLGVIWLLPEDLEYYRRLPPGLATASPSAMQAAARMLNRRLTSLAKANPCHSFNQISAQIKSELDDATKQLLQGLVDIFGSSGRADPFSEIVRLILG